jgi:outer membrane protein TolC
MASYNSMWMDRPHQYMVGLSVNVPIYVGKRSAAVEEADARLSRQTFEQQRLEDEVRVEVEKARQRLVESMHLLHLYKTRLIPAARDQVAAARSGFETGRNNFPAVIDAEKNLRAVALRAEMALADVHRREAELQRTIGEIPGTPQKEASR